MSKRKANIRPDLVGEFFTDGKSVFELLKCEVEPKAVMRKLADPEMETLDTEKPISFFANYVQLKPIRPIEKPKKPKKPRADLGGTHKKLTSEAIIKLASEAITGGTHKKAATNRAQKEVPTDAEAAALEDEPETADKNTDNLYIHVPTSPGDTLYCVNIAGSEASGTTLRATVLAALEEWNGEIPDELTEQQRATIQGILNAGK